MSNNLKKMVKSISIKIIQFKNYLIYLTKCRSLDQRYEVAVEVRNNLVAASQNLQGAQNYLSSVKFPYCAPPEVDTLNKVRIDMLYEDD